ncbi:MAG TPA: hypothetical protein DDZ41_09910, partial [Flavobacterium sp.]|nr:hypothetical protein [Flavobacterium sp.]
CSIAELISNETDFDKKLFVLLSILMTLSEQQLFSDGLAVQQESAEALEVSLKKEFKEIPAIELLQ